MASRLIINRQQDYPSNRWDLVPYNVIHEGEIATHDHREREQEHINDRVLEAHVEKQHNRHPHGGHFCASRRRDHRANHAHRHHPVTQHATNEDGKPTACTMRLNNPMYEIHQSH